MTFACLASTTDTVPGRYGDEPGLNGAEISSMERGQRSRNGAQGLPLLHCHLCFPLHYISGWEQGGRTNWNSILQLCTNKLMNDNGLLIEGTGAIHSADCSAANGVLRVVMATGAEKLWRSPDLSRSQIIFYTCSPQSVPPVGCICIHEYL